MKMMNKIQAPQKGKKNACETSKEAQKDWQRPTTTSTNNNNKMKFN